MDTKKLLFLFGILWSITLLSSCSPKPEVKENSSKKENMKTAEIIEVDEDQTDIFAVPLDMSEEEEQEEENELRQMEKNQGKN